MSDRHALPPYSLRMPQELREQLDSAAKANRRSLNAEIVARLDESFAPRTMDDIEAVRPAQLERELADLSVQSYHLAYELNFVQKQINQAKTNEDRLRLINQADELSGRIGKVEALRMQKMQQAAMLEQRYEESRSGKDK